MSIEQQSIENEETVLEGVREELLRLGNDVNQEIERINALKEQITPILEKYLNKYINLKFYFKDDSKYLILELDDRPSSLPQCKIDIVSGKLFINNKDSNISLIKYLKNPESNSEDENSEFAIMLINGMELAIKENNLDKKSKDLDERNKLADERMKNIDNFMNGVDAAFNKNNTKNSNNKKKGNNTTKKRK